MNRKGDKEVVLRYVYSAAVHCRPHGALARYGVLRNNPCHGPLTLSDPRYPAGVPLMHCPGLWTHAERFLSATTYYAAGGGVGGGRGVGRLTGDGWVGDKGQFCLRERWIVGDNAPCCSSFLTSLSGLTRVILV